MENIIFESQKSFGSKIYFKSIDFSDIKKIYYKKHKYSSGETYYNYTFINCHNEICVQISVDEQLKLKETKCTNIFILE